MKTFAYRCRQFFGLAVLLAVVGCNKVERDWNHARKEDTRASYQDFLLKHPSSNHSVAANERIREMFWAETHTANTERALEVYLKRYPTAPNQQEARTRLEELVWNQIAQSSFPADFERFAERFPGGKREGDAKQRIEALVWEAVRIGNDLGVVNRYISEHASSRYLPDARTLAENLTWVNVKRQNTIDGFKEFMTNSPNSPHLGEAQGALQSLKWKTVTSSRKPESIEAYLSEYPAAHNRAEAEILLDDVSYYSARTADSAESYGLYMKRFPRGRHFNSANERVKVLRYLVKELAIGESMGYKSGSITLKPGQNMRSSTASFTLETTDEILVGRDMVAGKLRIFPIGAKLIVHGDIYMPTAGRDFKVAALGDVKSHATASGARTDALGRLVFESGPTTTTGTCILTIPERSQFVEVHSDSSRPMEFEIRADGMFLTAGKGTVKVFDGPKYELEK